MRARFFFPALPRNPLLRILVLAGAVVTTFALLAVGLVVGIGAVCVATLALTIRHWRTRGKPRSADPSIIDGEYTVVPSRPPDRLPRAE